MKEDINDIEDLIGKVLAGEATPSEQSRLDSWIDSSPANRKYFDQVKTVFDAAVKPVPLVFDTDSAWLKVKSKLNEERKSIPFIPETRPLWPGLRIAAGIAFILSAGWLIYRSYSTPTETFALRSDSVTVSNTLPDGSTVFLNSNSRILYEFSPGKKTRKVKLTGESFFEVKHEEEKSFVIEAEGVLVRDIGTSFNVRAYPQSDSVEVVVKTGEVQVYTLENSGLNLKAGQTGIYRRSSKEFFLLEKIDSNTLAYKTRVFVFKNTDLKTILDKINKVYHSKIRLENPVLQSCTLTVSFNNETLDTIVEVISETLKLSVTRKEKEIYLNGTGCN